MKKRFFLTVAVLFAAAIMFMPPIGAKATSPSGPANFRVIDISVFNGSINWDALNGNVDAVYARATDGFFYDHQTEQWIPDYVDSNVDTYAANAHARGIPIGYYEFFWPSTNEAYCRKRADQFYAKIKSLGYSCIPVVDIEYTTDKESVGAPFKGGASLDGSQITASVQTFINEFKAVSGGQDIMIYTGQYFARDTLQSSLHPYKLWVASYIYNTNWNSLPTTDCGWNQWSMWQYSDSGSVPGVSGDVDMDIATSDIFIENYYNGVNYSAVYNWSYYINRYPDLYAAFRDNKAAAIAHFVNCGMKEGRQGCDSFDVNSYRRAYRDLRATFGNDLRGYYMHYINFGKNEGRVATGVATIQGATTVYNGVDYSAVYNYNFYASNYSDIKNIFGLDDDGALAHFVTYGMNEGRQGCASFDVNSYRLAYRDLRAAFGNNLKDYYMHYIGNGRAEGRVATGVTTMQGAATVYNGVDYSAVYNYNYYTSTYGDIKNIFGLDDDGALAHFVTYGMNEGRQGSASFDVNSYRRAYRDLRAAFGNNLKSYYQHYVRYGKAEGRVATGVTTMQGATTVYNGVDYSAVYDYNYYTSTYGDIRSAFGLDDDDALAHFVIYGMNEGRQGCASFNVGTYRNNYSDLRAAFGNNLKAYYLHYIQYGKSEGRTAV